MASPLDSGPDNAIFGDDALVVGVAKTEDMYFEKVPNRRVAGCPRQLIFAFCLAIVWLGLIRPGLIGAGQVAECLECHAQPDLVTVDSTGTERSLYVDSSTYQNSSHGELSCIDCHQGITELPHAEKLPKVDCGGCHESEKSVYQQHGRLKVSKDRDIPSCADCHGRHDIFPVTSKRSSVYPTNLPRTCGACHQNLDIVKRHGIPVEKPIEVFESSVHGRASIGGIYMAATCNDCHSTQGTAHMILPPGDPNSSINHFNIPKTCGQCHRGVESDFWEGVHGKLVARGETDAPVCTDCHGEHGILSTRDPRSPVSPSRVAEATCSPCHESARLNEKYGIPTGRLKTWVDSYHGLKSRAGDITVANCASCHGAHRILPHTDPTSSIHPSNLQKTCGHCHPGISATLAMTPVHGVPGISSTPAANIVRLIYVVAIAVIIGLMSSYVVIDFRRHLRQQRQRPQVQRMTYGELWQHMFLLVTFFVLVITGFSLRFSQAFWVKLIFGWEGGFALRGTIHRVAAAIFIGTVIWHLIYLTTKRGRAFLADISPRQSDFRQFFQMIAHNLGLSKNKPSFGRFSFIEKAEYWALVWGAAVMIGSGFFLWFENVAVKWFPKGFLDVMLVIHYYEAWLATLAILIWHLYFTVYKPGIYPMNPSWYTTMMPEEMYREEHPAAPLPTILPNGATESSGHDSGNSPDSRPES